MPRPIHSALALTSFALLGAAPAGAQQSRAVLDAPLVVSDNARLRLVLDLDGDGDDDAVSWSWTNSNAEPLRLQGWINDGTGVLVPTWESLLQGQWTTAATVRMGAGDFDQDGREDFWVLVNNSLGSDFEVLRSLGDQPPVEHGTLYDWHEFSAAGIAGGQIHDWTGDGVPERALLTGDGWLRTWVLTQTSGTVCSFAQLGPGWTDLLLVDANGDDQPDLLAVRPGELRLVEMQGCQFGAQTSFVTPLSGMPMPTVGDVDGDGDEDIVVFDMLGSIVVRRLGPTSWLAEPYRAGGIGTDLADVDGDGDLDAVCCGGGGGGGPTPWVNDVLSTFRVSLNDGTGVFAPAIEIPGLGADHLAGVSDLDHDGDVDLVAGRCVLYASAPITAHPMPRVGSGAQQPRASVDFDDDGDLDLEVGLVQVEENRGDGVVTPAPRWTPSAPAGMELHGPGFPGDFDGDGDQDLVVAMHSSSNGAFVSMRLLLNAGGGRLVDGGAASAPNVDFNVDLQGTNRPEASVAVDLDGDGDLDLVTRSVAGSSPTSKTWFNLGGGFFARGGTFTLRHFVTAADFDGDSIPDALFTDSKPRIHWGLGDGSFPDAGSTSFEIPVDWVLDRYAVADLDGDGDLDLAGIARNSGESGYPLRWARNEGNRSFTLLSLPGLYDPRSAWPKTVLAADLNGDGRTDLVAGPLHRARSAAAIHLRLADNSGWEAPREQVVWANDGAEPVFSCGLLADIDGDGDADLVTDRAIKNRLHEGLAGGFHREIGSSLCPPGLFPPSFGGKGPFRPGEAAELRLRGAPPGIEGVFTSGYKLTTFDVPTPGLEPFVITHRYAIQTSGRAGGEMGSGSWTLPYVVPAYKAGRLYRYQVELLDPQGVYLRPNRLAVQYGQ